MKNKTNRTVKGNPTAQRKIESLYGNNRRIQEILADDDFGIDIKDSPIKRTKWEGMQRNLGLFSKKSD